MTAGTNATYTITLTNNGPNAAQAVVLTDIMPAGSTFVSMTRTAGNDAFTFAQSGGTITETATANIASGSSDTFSLVVFSRGQSDCRLEFLQHGCRQQQHGRSQHGQ